MAKTNGGRDSRGRFGKGNPGGPGNPYARRVAALRSALLEEVTPERLRKIARKLADEAERGDFAAAKLLFSYTVGKPPEAPDPDRLDLDEKELEAEHMEARRRESEARLFADLYSGEDAAA